MEQRHVIGSVACGCNWHPSCPAENPIEAKWRLETAAARILLDSVGELPDGFTEYWSNLRLTGKFNGWTE